MLPPSPSMDCKGGLDETLRSTGTASANEMYSRYTGKGRLMMTSTQDPRYDHFPSSCLNQVLQEVEVDTQHCFEANVQNKSHTPPQSVDCGKTDKINPDISWNPGSCHSHYPRLQSHRVATHFSTVANHNRSTDHHMKRQRQACTYVYHITCGLTRLFI